MRRRSALIGLSVALAAAPAMAQFTAPFDGRWIGSFGSRPFGPAAIDMTLDSTGISKPVYVSRPDDPVPGRHFQVYVRHEGWSEGPEFSMVLVPQFDPSDDRSGLQVSGFLSEGQPVEVYDAAVETLAPGAEASFSGTMHRAAPTGSPPAPGRFEITMAGRGQDGQPRPVAIGVTLGADGSGSWVADRPLGFRDPSGAVEPVTGGRAAADTAVDGYVTVQLYRPPELPLDDGVLAELYFDRAALGADVGASVPLDDDSYVLHSPLPDRNDILEAREGSTVTLTGDEP